MREFVFGNMNFLDTTLRPISIEVNMLWADSNECIQVDLSFLHSQADLPKEDKAQIGMAGAIYLI